MEVKRSWLFRTIVNDEANCSLLLAEYHIMMISTDYSTYMAYIACDESRDYNFPIISSTTLDMDPELVAEITNQFQDLGANMDAFTQIRHDDECQYE